MSPTESSIPDEGPGVTQCPPVGLYEVGIEGTVRRAMRIGVGSNAAEMTGCSIFELVPESERPRLDNCLRQALDAGRAGRFQYRARHSGDNDRIFEARIAPVPGGEAVSAHIAIIAMSRDMTGSQLADAALQARERRFRMLIETGANAIALVNAEGTVGYASPAAAQILGYMTEEIQGASLFQFVAPKSHESVKALLASALHNPGTPFVLNAEGLRKDGARNLLEGVLSNLLDVPELEAIVCSFRDITEQQRQRKALEQAHREADMFRRMVDFAPQAIGTADLEARVLYQNPALLRLLGNPSLEAARQHTFEDFYDEKNLDYLRRVVIPTVLTDGYWTGEIELKPLDREAVPTIHNVYLVRNDEGMPIAFSNVVTDISAQKDTEAALRTSEAKYRHLFEEALFGIAVADPDTGVLLDCNPALCHMVRRTREELIGQPQRILHPPDALVGDVSVSFELHRSGRNDRVSVERLITSDGEIRYVEIKASFVELAGRKALQGVFHDVTERKRAQEALLEEKERVQVTLHSIGDAVIATDDKGRVNYLNPVAETLTGWSAADACGRDLHEVFRARDEITGEPLADPVASCLHGGRGVHVSGPAVLIGRNGREYDIDQSAAPIRRPDGTVLGAVLVFHDVTSTRQLARQMVYDAAHDPLTGLINRRAFAERLEHALESAGRYGFTHALCYIDLDQFKIVNDTAGHAAGDELLKQIKAMTSGTFRDRDTLARLGGDEFGLLMHSCPVEQAVAIATKIVDAIRNYRFVWQGRAFQIGASIGVTAITRDSESAERVLSQADVACYAAKEQGRNRVHLYHETGGAPMQRHGEILRAAGLRDALELDRFRLYCQPILPLHGDGQDPLGFELLLRLLDSENGLILPGAFIPAAERFGLMGDLDRWVIRTAFHAFGKGLDRKRMRIFVNLSGNSLNDESLLDYVSAQFKASSLPPERVCFEITETAAVYDFSRALRFISSVKELGCQLALDDFGSGLSYLRYLKTLPVDYLKIDGSFVEGIDKDHGDRAIVAAVIELARQLGIRTIAEHASSQVILDRLRALGVDYAQGYALGRPLPLSLQP